MFEKIMNPVSTPHSPFETIRKVSNPGNRFALHPEAFQGGTILASYVAIGERGIFQIQPADS